MTLSDLYEQMQGVPTPRTRVALDAATALLSDGKWHTQIELVTIMVSGSDLQSSTAKGVLATLTRSNLLERDAVRKVKKQYGKFRTVYTNVRYRLI